MFTRARDLTSQLQDQLAVASNFARLLEELSGENAAWFGGQTGALTQSGLDFVTECPFERDDCEFGPEVGGGLDTGRRLAKVMLQHERREAFDPLQGLPNGGRVTGLKCAHDE